LLLAIDSNYPTQQRFRVRQHTVESVAKILEFIEPPEAKWMLNVPTGVQTALDVFIGYVMLDAWIANVDRHHENWGAIWSEKLHLAPTFDHGASLARNLTDEERRDRLATKDRNRTVAAFAARGRSAFYRDTSATRAVDTVTAFRLFGQFSAISRDVWLYRLQSVEDASIQDILSQVPDKRMSKITREFTIELLRVNRQRLLDEITK